jgi:glycine/D-amino acid oxidase-like deaminating enzyme
MARRNTTGDGPVVAVVGAGVIGAATALHLARRGVRVHCVERAARPGTGTTAVGFATATAYRRFPRAYFDLNQAGIAEHAALAAELAGSSWWHPTGTLAWSDEESFGGYLDLLAEWGCTTERHDHGRAHRVLRESVAFPDTGVVAVLPSEGWIDAVAFTRRLLSEAVDLGATLDLDTELASVDLADGHVAGIRLADGGRMAVDVLVNATGSGADRIAAMVGARPFLGAPRRSLIAHLLVDGEPLRHVLRAPDISIRPDGPGRVVMRSDQVDRRLPPRSGTPDPELVKDLLDRAGRVVPLLGSGTVREATVVEARCARDDLPSIGPLSAVPGYYEAVASAGVTLAPLFGRVLADHVVEGTLDPSIAPFTPDRFEVDAA